MLVAKPLDQEKSGGASGWRVWFLGSATFYLAKLYMQAAQPPAPQVGTAKPLVYYIKRTMFVFLFVCLFVCPNFVLYLVLNGWDDFDETF